MLKNAYERFIGTPTVALEEGRGADWRAAKDEVEAKETAAPVVKSTVERFPNSLQATIKCVDRYKRALVIAEGERVSAENTYLALKAEWEAKIDQLTLIEQRTLGELKVAQKRMGREMLDLGAFDRVDGDMTISEFLNDGSGSFDDTRVPTVRIEG